MFTKAGTTARIFSLVYERGKLTKQVVARELELSLPTVTNGLVALEQEGLVERRGTFSSTGGRPATAYAFRPASRCALGIELVANRVRLAAVDLYGTPLAQREEPISFERSGVYLDRISALANDMLLSLQQAQSIPLGATVAIQGIVANGQKVSFAGLLGDNDVFVSLDDFASRLSYPIRLVHDAEAAAFAEFWRHEELRDFAYLSLNDHLGSAMVVNGRLLAGGELGAGVVEHITLRPNGRRCYCGNVGCAETVLSAAVFENMAGIPLDEFSGALRTGDAHAKGLWKRYLDDLGLLIHNIRMIACCDVVLGGRLAHYLTETDLRTLRMNAASHGQLAKAPFRLVRGHFGSQATVIGAGLLLVDEYLQSIRSPAQQ